MLSAYDFVAKLREIEKSKERVRSLDIIADSIIDYEERGLKYGIPMEAIHCGLVAEMLMTIKIHGPITYRVSPVVAEYVKLLAESLD